MYSVWAFILRFGIEIHLTSTLVSVDIGQAGISANFGPGSPPPISVFEAHLPARPTNWHQISVGWDPIDGFGIFIHHE